MTAKRLFLIDPQSGIATSLRIEEGVKATLLGALSGSGVRWAEITADSDGTIDMAFEVKESSAEIAVQQPAPRTPRKRRKATNHKRKRCPECGGLFTRLGIGPHMALKHGKFLHGKKVKSGRNAAPRKGEPKLLPCPVCNTVFGAQGLLTHIRAKHPTEAKAASRIAASDKERTAKDNTTQQFLRDLVAGRKSIPQTALGVALVEAAQEKLQ